MAAWSTQDPGVWQPGQPRTQVYGSLVNPGPRRMAAWYAISLFRALTLARSIIAKDTR